MWLCEKELVLLKFLVFISSLSVSTKPMMEEWVGVVQPFRKLEGGVKVGVYGMFSSGRIAETEYKGQAGWMDGVVGDGDIAVEREREMEASGNA